MKIGLLVITGDIHRFGYQNTHKHVIASHAAFADQIILLSSSRNNPPELGSEYPNLLHLSDKQTWFKQKNGIEIFSYDVLVNNNNRALQMLKDMGCDIAMQVHVNQYISEETGKAIRKTAAKLIKSGRPFTWQYKKYQLGEMIFNADVRLPWILNLTIDNPYRYVPDSLEHTGTGVITRIEHGDFSAHNAEAVTDMLMHYVMQDAQDLFLFTQAENIKLSGRTAGEIAFNPEEWRAYHLNKINQKVVSKEKPGKPGQLLLKERKKDFLSHYYEAHYQPVKRSAAVNIARKLKGRLTR